MKWHRLAFIGASLLVVLSAQATTLNFKSGAKFDGEVVEVKGTNVLARSEKDGKTYTIPVAYLSDVDQMVITGHLPSHEDSQAAPEMAGAAKPPPEQPEKKGDESQIVGAFGLKLGQVFDLRNATATNKYERDVFVKNRSFKVEVTEYDFKPSSPLPLFSHYQVAVTPRSNRVYDIIGATSTAKVERSKVVIPDEREKLLSILEQKYGQAEPSRDGTTRWYIIRRGDCKVHLISDDDRALILTYEDTVLREQAEREQLELDAADPAKQGERNRLKEQL